MLRLLSTIANAVVRQQSRARVSEAAHPPALPTQLKWLLHLLASAPGQGGKGVWLLSTPAVGAAPIGQAWPSRCRCCRWCCWQGKRIAVTACRGGLGGGGLKAEEQLQAGGVCGRVQGLWAAACMLLPEHGTWVKRGAVRPVVHKSRRVQGGAAQPSAGRSLQLGRPLACKGVAVRPTTRGRRCLGVEATKLCIRMAYGWLPLAWCASSTTHTAASCACMPGPGAKGGWVAKWAGG